MLATEVVPSSAGRRLVIAVVGAALLVWFEHRPTATAHRHLRPDLPVEEMCSGAPTVEGKQMCRDYVNSVPTAAEICAALRSVEQQVRACERVETWMRTAVCPGWSPDQKQMLDAVLASRGGVCVRPELGGAPPWVTMTEAMVRDTIDEAR